LRGFSEHGKEVEPVKDAYTGTTGTEAVPTSAPRGLRGLLRIVGPGIVVAATGVGAGDLVAATKAGAIFGLPLLWTALVGALLKFVLAEGVARWQLATGSTVLEGWVRIFGRGIHAFFVVYLLVWTLIVAAALMSVCGLAAHALLPFWSVATWAIVHAVAALLFVWLGGYGALEHVMKWAVGLMFLSILGSAVLHFPAPFEVLRGLTIPSVPPGATVLALGAIGGVGGSLTLLSYNYWMKEKGWSGPGWVRGVRFDLAVGYILTGLFGLAVILLGAVILRPRGVVVEGNASVLEMALMLGERFGHAGEIVFLVGFWGAVVTSLLGVWQGIPYLFGNYVGLLRGLDKQGMARVVSRRGWTYRGYLLFMTFPPMFFLLLEKPVWLIVAYAALGALFMPFLAATLLVMNNRESVMGELRNRWLTNTFLVLNVALFVYLGLSYLGLT